MKYAEEPDLTVAEFIDVLRRSKLAERRPVDQPRRVEAMLRNADVIITARDDHHQLVGVARSITDHAYCTYLSDLAVDERYQRQGIGKELIRLSHKTAGMETRLILLAAPAAVQYYPHVGFESHPSCWMLPPVGFGESESGVAPVAG
ncbi:MAG: GNAT family N-acetyltransferase [Planctomycetota bacterium]